MLGWSSQDTLSSNVNFIDILWLRESPHESLQVSVLVFVFCDLLKP